MASIQPTLTEETQKVIVDNNSTASTSVETSPNTAKKSVKSAWVKNENSEAKVEGSQKLNNEQNLSNTSNGDELQTSPEKRSQENNIPRGGQPWRKNVRKPTKVRISFIIN